MDCKLITGQWVDAFDGIGQVLSLHDFYVEEFSPEVAEGKAVGDHLITLCVYKMLCGYDGKIRKKKLILTCDANLVTPICKDSQAIVDDIRSKKPADYKKYTEYLTSSPLGDAVYIWLNLPDDVLDECSEKIALINNELTKPFSYPDFVGKVKQHKMKLNLDSMHSQSCDERSNFILSFFNEGFVVENKRAQFVEVKGVVNR